MKKASRALAVIMLMALLVNVIPGAASAVTHSYTATAGDFQYFQFFLDYEDIVEEAFFSNGYIDGMSISISNDSSVALSGVIENPGYYSVDVVVSTQRAGYYFYTLNITVEPAPTDPPATDPPIIDPPVSAGTPIVTKHPSSETVVEGDSAMFISLADNTRQYAWEIAIADAVIDCVDLPSYLGGGVAVSGCNSDTLVISNIPAGLNGAYVWCRFVGAEESAYSSSAMITVIPLDQATPEITKSPTDETVDEGGSAEFVASANHYKSCLWQLVSPTGVTYDCTKVSGTFAGLEVSGATSEVLSLKNIPAELNGYSVVCKFSAGSTVSSGSAKLTVNAAPTEATTAPTEAEVKSNDRNKNRDNTAAEETEAATEAATTSGRVPGNSNGRNNGKNAETESNSELPVVAIIAAAAVVIALIAAFVILKLNANKKRGN